MAKFLNVVSLALLLAFSGLTVWSWSSLPDQVPAHFQLSGQPDRYGGKGNLVFLNVAGVFLYTLLSIAPRNRNWINVPGTRTERKIDIAIAMLHVLNVLVMLMFLAIVYATVSSGALFHGFLLLPLALLATIGVSFLKMSQDAS